MSALSFGSDRQSSPFCTFHAFLPAPSKKAPTLFSPKHPLLECCNPNQCESESSTKHQTILTPSSPRLRTVSSCVEFFETRCLRRHNTHIIIVEEVQELEFAFLQIIIRQNRCARNVFSWSFLWIFFFLHIFFLYEIVGKVSILRLLSRILMGFSFNIKFQITTQIVNNHLPPSALSSPISRTCQDKIFPS